MTWPTGSAFGHIVRAVVSETTATDRFGVVSAGVNARPRTTAMSSTRKYSGDTNLYATLTLTALVSAKAARCPRSGHEAATTAIDGSAVTACTNSSRACSFTIWTTTV